VQRRPGATIAAIGLVILGAVTLVLEQVMAAPDTPRKVRISPRAQAETRQVEARINQSEAESTRREHGDNPEIWQAALAA